MALHVAERIQDHDDSDCFVDIHAHILDITHWTPPYCWNLGYCLFKITTSGASFHITCPDIRCPDIRWETDYARIRPEYFDAADARLRHLMDEGFIICLVGAWGYFLPMMGETKINAHWRYLIARYAAWPVVWCAAGEANLPWYLAKNFPSDDRTMVPAWSSVMRQIRATDPFHRLLTIHPTAINRYNARHVTDDAALLDFDFLQTPHGQRGAVPVTVRAVRESFTATPTLPVIDGEAA